MAAGVAQVIAGVARTPVPLSGMLCVAATALSELSVNKNHSLNVPSVLGANSTLRLQLAPAAREKVSVQSGGVPLPVTWVKPAGAVKPGATAINAVLPMFS